MAPGWYVDAWGAVRWWDGYEWRAAPPPPGWNPDGHGSLRWWDGVRWHNTRIKISDITPGLGQRKQAVVVGLYWLAFASLILATVSIGGFTIVHPAAETWNITLGFLAMSASALLGSLMTTRLRGLHLNYSDFVRSTTTTRIVVLITFGSAVGLVVLELVVLVVGVVVDLNGRSVDAVTRSYGYAEQGFAPLFQLVGWVTLIGTLTTGYSEYHLGILRATESRNIFDD